MCNVHNGRGMVLWGMSKRWWEEGIAVAVVDRVRGWELGRMLNLIDF